jgi:hypothetical protein
MLNRGVSLREEINLFLKPRSNARRPISNSWIYQVFKACEIDKLEDSNTKCSRDARRRRGAVLENEDRAENSAIISYKNT